MPDEGSEAAEVCPEEARVLSAYVYSSLAVALAEAGGGRSLGWLLRGILLGLGAAVPIGPVNVEIARRALAAGSSPASRSGAARSPWTCCTCC